MKYIKEIAILILLAIAGIMAYLVVFQKHTPALALDLIKKNVGQALTNIKNAIQPKIQLNNGIPVLNNGQGATNSTTVLNGYISNWGLGDI